MTDTNKKRVREYASKHGMSYQAAWNLLEGDGSPQKALEFWDWEKMVKRRRAGLTIADILALKPGDRVQVLAMDRNLCDHVYPWRPGEPPGPTLPAKQFFEKKRDGAVYIHEGGLRGRVEWGWDHEGERAHEPFQFEIEFKEGNWHPLDDDGTLPSANEPHMVKGPPGEPAMERRHWDELPPTRQHWTEFPKTTRVGWRGPMVRWDALADLPPVFTAIDVDRMAARAAVEWIPGATGIVRDRLQLRRTDGDWVLSVENLTDEERADLKARLKGTTVVDGDELRAGLRTKHRELYAT